MSEKTNKKSIKVFHYDLYGKRNHKYEFLNENQLKDIKFNELAPKEPFLAFVNIDWEIFDEYSRGISIELFFSANSLGLQTHRDSFIIDRIRKELENRLEIFASLDEKTTSLIERYELKNTRDFSIDKAIQYLRKNSDWLTEIEEINYRPFDNQFTLLNSLFIDRPRKFIKDNISHRNNFILGVGRQGIAVGEIEWCLVGFYKHPVDANIFRRGGVNLFPAYLYSTSELENTQTRRPNLDLKLIAKIAEKLKLEFIPDHEHERAGEKGTFNPLDILDYIYAILHSPTYRERYKEFLKIDFPRVPFTSNQELFWKLVAKGRELREYHLMEHKNSNNLITKFPISGENEVTRKLIKNSPGFIKDSSSNLGKVWINDEQYFENVPEIAWNFYIGGYQPAQKWLKDRVGRKLNFEDILHYQKIIVALVNTDRVMKEIDRLVTEWPIK